MVRSRTSNAVIALAILVGGTTADAQSPRQRPAPNERPAASEQPSSGDVQRCIEVQIGNEKSFDCFNQSFRRQVDRVNPVLNQPPISAGSSDTRVGAVNVPAVRQQYGTSFGRSVIPQRPAPPIFSGGLRR